MAIKLGKLLGTGATTEVYEYGNDKVCKLYLAQYGIDSVKYEYDKTLDAYKNGLPAPKVYEIIEHNGRFGLIIERIHGVTFKNDSDNYTKKCIESGDCEQEIIQSILDYSIKQIKETAAVLYNLHKKSCKLKSNIKDSFVWHCNKNSFLNQNEKSAIIRIIENLPDSDHVCHGDPNPNNYIYSSGGIKIIDWVDSVNSHPFYDIARYKIMNEYSEEEDLSGYPEHIIDLHYQHKNNVFNIFKDEYIRLSGIDFTGLDNWIIPTLVFSMGGNHSECKQQRLLEGIRSGLRQL